MKFLIRRPDETTYNVPSYEETRNMIERRIEFMMGKFTGEGE